MQTILGDAVIIIVKNSFKLFNLFYKFVMFQGENFEASQIQLLISILEWCHKSHKNQKRVPGPHPLTPPCTLI